MSFKDILIALLVIFLWAINFVILKKVGEGISLAVFNLMRFLCFIPFLFICKKPAVGFYKLLLTAMFWNFLTFLFMGVGLEKGVSVGVASVLFQTCSFFGVIFCYLLVKEVPSYFQIFGMIISFFGVTLLFNDRFLTPTSFSAVIYVLFSAVSWGVGSSLFKKYKLSADISTTVWLASISAVPMGFLSYFQEGKLILEKATEVFSFSLLACVIFAAYGSTLLGGCFWIKLLNKNHGSKVTPFMLLLPPMSGILSYLFLGEKYTLLEFVSFVTILFGLSVSLNVFRLDLIKYKMKDVWKKLILTN